MSVRTILNAYYDNNFNVIKASLVIPTSGIRYKNPLPHNTPIANAIKNIRTYL